MLAEKGSVMAVMAVMAVMPCDWALAGANFNSSVAVLFQLLPLPRHRHYSLSLLRVPGRVRVLRSPAGGADRCWICNPYFAVGDVPASRLICPLEAVPTLLRSPPLSLPYSYLLPFLAALPFFSACGVVVHLPQSFFSVIGGFAHFLSRLKHWLLPHRHY
jgi:hypothetical protein